MSTTMNQPLTGDDWACACHLTRGGAGSVVLLQYRGGRMHTTALTQGPASGLEEARRPVLVGIAQDHSALLLDLASRRITTQREIPADAVPVYAYLDPATGTYWMVSDGDKETGVDHLSCGGKGAPVTVVKSAGVVTPSAPLEVICAGRGHHVAVFTQPTAQYPHTPHRAFLSNLLEGSITVVDNDPAAEHGYLKVLATINLYDPAHEQGERPRLPNSAFPHGMAYSRHTGKLYNLNNGYGTVAVIDPVRNVIEKSYSMPVSSNLLLSPDGRYLVGKGVDRRANADHLIGRLSVMDASTGELAATLDLPDVYPSVYRFNADGSKLYVTTAVTGKGAQKANAKLNTLLVFDSSLPSRLRLIKEVEIGTADCGRRPLAFFESADGKRHVLVPNPTDGTLSIVDGVTDTVTETVSLGAEALDEVNFLYWRSPVHGA